MKSKKNKQVLFYGATNYAVNNINKHIEIAGEPVAIIKDDRWDNYPDDMVCNKFPVISLEEAISKYPDADIWFTYREAGGVPSELAKIVDPNRIKFLEGDLEYRKGCESLGKIMAYSPESFAPCCAAIKGSSVATSGTVKERIKHWEKHVAKLIENIKEEKPCACLSCPRLRYGFYPKKPRLSSINFTSDHPGDVCNFRCIYCIPRLCLDKLRSAKGDTTYEILKQLSELEEYNTSALTVSLSNGEVCVNKYRNEIFDILLKTKWRIKIVSNMSLYNEKLAQVLKTGRVIDVITSLDSGTAETFKKVKQADFYYKVLDNLKKYPFENTSLQLKYIFLDGVNDNIEDVDGFFEAVKSANCKTVILSGDDYKPFTEKIKKLMVRFLEKAKNNDIRVLHTYLSVNDQEFFYNEYNRIWFGKETCTSQSSVSGKNNEVIVIKDNKPYEITDNDGISVHIEGDNNKLTIVLNSSEKS